MCVSKGENGQCEVEGEWLRERRGGWDYSKSRLKAGYLHKGVEGDKYRIIDDYLRVSVI